MLKFIISEADAGKSIKQYLKSDCHFSRRLLTRLTQTDDSVLVNHQRRRIDYRLKAKDQLMVRLPAETVADRLEAEAIALDLVYEDDYFLVLNKPAGIAVMPSFNYPRGTIANGILAYYHEKNLPYTVHIVTRLDRNTSGVMLIAKHHYSHSLFARLLQAGGIRRSYIAAIHGHLKQASGTIDAPIARSPESIIKRRVHPSGKPARTHYRILEENQLYTKVHIELETGRTHQIRVHFSAIGHPLVGDDLYGSDGKHLSRQALHCHELAFTHPVTGEYLSFSKALPEDIERLF